MANILVIDDDKDIQRLLEFALKRAGHSVDVAYDGEQGMAQAEEQPPDLMVVDVMMPKMTGYEFCRQARKKPTLKDVPIIIFSARFQPIDKQTALEAGATDYLAKSSPSEVLVKRISELLNTEKPTDMRGTLALFSLRGGSGVTSVAANLAIALALNNKNKVTLVDLAPLGGHAALMLGIRPSSDVSRLLAANHNITAEAIRPYLMQHPSKNVQLMASAPSYGSQLVPEDDQLLHLIRGLKSITSINVLDTPDLLAPAFAPLLQLIDQVLIVISADMPAVQSTVIALQGLAKLGFSPKKIGIVINQVSQYNSLPIETIRKAIRRPPLAAIPFDPNMVQAVNSGKPLLLTNPESPAAKAISDLSKKLLA